MKTINIKGKEYVQVNERVKEFRNNEKYKGYSLLSEIIHFDEKSILIKATILDENGKPIATGLAQEDKDSSMINKTSYVENCESSAWGRALGNLGIGIDVAICSAEEVKTAIEKQEREQGIKQETSKQEITIEDAKMRKTTKGKYYYELDDKQLQWIVDSEKSSAESKQCAEMVLQDRQSLLNDCIEIEDGDLPF